MFQIFKAFHDNLGLIFKPFSFKDIVAVFKCSPVFLDIDSLTKVIEFRIRIPLHPDPKTACMGKVKEIELSFEEHDPNPGPITEIPDPNKKFANPVRILLTRWLS